MRRRWVLLFLFFILAWCAQGTLPLDDDAGGDATTSDASCPQYNTMTDPAHCGSCTNACPSGQVCSSGKCAANCSSPTTKCTSTDGGAICATLTSDPDHCGQCNTVCTLGDAGGLPPGTNNPDSGIPNNGGVDAGAGWSTGTPACDASTCTVNCSGGMTDCNGVCFDLQNHHDHCGTCTTACAPTDWCNSGNCCPPGQEYCAGACIDVLSNDSNCGSCGNACSGATPYCSNGTCVKGCVPSGTRQAFNTLSSSTVTGCWKGNPCGTDTYSFAQTNGVNYQHVGENIVCGGTTACIGHVGINTYTGSSSICQGTWDILCDGTKVGSIDTTGKTCGGTAMTNTCNTSFVPTTCSTVTVQLSAGSGAILCCDTTGTNPDSMLVGVSAW